MTHMATIYFNASVECMQGEDSPWKVWSQHCVLVSQLNIGCCFSYLPSAPGFRVFASKWLYFTPLCIDLFDILRGNKKKK